MTGRIENVQISCAGQDADAYRREAGALAELYGELLGMERYDPGYIKIAKPAGTLPEIGFESDESGEEVRPRWPDPDHPQQLHLDIEVGDVDAAEQIALGLGATTLQDAGDHRVLADPIGHPFCLYQSKDTGPGRIARIVFDCFSPRALARFYEDLLDMPARVLDTPERVVIASSTNDRPTLAFQHAVVPPPRWPDPAYPPQLHLDLSFEDEEAGVALMERLGAVRLASKQGHTVYADPAAHPFCMSSPAPPEWRDEYWSKRPASRSRSPSYPE